MTFLKIVVSISTSSLLMIGSSTWWSQFHADKRIDPSLHTHIVVTRTKRAFYLLECVARSEQAYCCAGTQSWQQFWVRRRSVPMQQGRMNSKKYMVVKS